MRSKNYYRIRLAVRVLFWGTLLTGVVAGATAFNKYLDNHTKLVNCHQMDLGWECDTAWKK